MFDLILKTHSICIENLLRKKEDLLRYSSSLTFAGIVVRSQYHLLCPTTTMLLDENMFEFCQKTLCSTEALTAKISTPHKRNMLVLFLEVNSYCSFWWKILSLCFPYKWKALHNLSVSLFSH